LRISFPALKQRNQLPCKHLELKLRLDLQVGDLSRKFPVECKRGSAIFVDCNIAY